MGGLSNGPIPTFPITTKPGLEGVGVEQKKHTTQLLNRTHASWALFFSHLRSPLQRSNEQQKLNRSCRQHRFEWSSSGTITNVTNVLFPNLLVEQLCFQKRYDLASVTAASPVSRIQKSGNNNTNSVLPITIVPLPKWCAIQHTTEPVPSSEKRRDGVRKGIRP